VFSLIDCEQGKAIVDEYDKKSLFFMLLNVIIICIHWLNLKGVLLIGWLNLKGMLLIKGLKRI